MVKGEFKMLKYLSIISKIIGILIGILTIIVIVAVILIGIFTEIAIKTISQENGIAYSGSRLFTILIGVMHISIPILIGGFIISGIFILISKVINRRVQK
jgi:ABC-type transport system involved in cytochrome c biogenesis permease subunit